MSGADVVAPGTILLTGIVGPTAHGLAEPGSGTERLGFYAAPTTALHGLELPTGGRGTVLYKNPVFSLYEAREMALRLLRADPGATELLWLPRHLLETFTPWGQELVRNRSRFLSAPRVAEGYLGRASTHLGRIRTALAAPEHDPARAQRHGRHVARLLEAAQMLYTTGELTVEASNPGRCYDWGRRLASRPQDGLALIAQVRRVLAEAATPLPAAPEVAWVNDWLVRLRAHH